MNKVKGFTLIEVLIAMLILAVGLLGMAILQTYSLRNNLTAYHHGQVTQLLYDMSDKMRANSKTVDASGAIIVNTALADYIIDNTTTNNRTSGKTISDTTCRTVANTTCTAKKLVEYDLIEWHNAIAATLPMGRGCIASTDNIIFNLYITWDDNRSGTIDTYVDAPTGCTNFGTKDTSTDKSHDPIFNVSLQL